MPTGSRRPGWPWRRTRARSSCARARLAQARLALAQDEGTIILRHLDKLTDPALRALTSALQDALSRQGVWVAAAVSADPPRQELARLLNLFPSTAQLPPLRHRIEDVEELVPFFLLRLSQGGHLTCSAEAMQLLLRFTWPGNVAQVLDTLRKVLRHRRTGVIQPADLPPEVQAHSRHRLSALESMERDAIVMGLLEASGNKTEAARALGMSRATIYRKIHEYGIASSVA